jgi:sulfopropanediol 3-dehydrogenase
MPLHYLKRALHTPASGESTVRATVEGLLAAIESGGEAAARRQARELDGWEGAILVDAEQRRAAREAVPRQLREDILASRDNVLRGMLGRADVAR